MTEREDKSKENEMLMALADGELDSAEAEALKRRIARDPQLAERYAAFAQTGDALRAALAPGDVPAHLIDIVHSAPLETKSHPRGTGRDTFAAGLETLRALWQPAALAATLAIGVGLGWMMRGSEGRAPSGADLPALAQAVADLPTGETREIEGAGQARVLGSFQTARGLCRLILSDSVPAGGARFVACRDGSGWQIAVSVAQADESGFSPASAAATEAIDLYLDAIGAGPALSAEAEAAELE